MLKPDFELIALVRERNTQQNPVGHGVEIRAVIERGGDSELRGVYFVVPTIDRLNRVGIVDVLEGFPAKNGGTRR